MDVSAAKAQIEHSLRASPIISALLDALPSLPVQAWIAAGSVTQAHWNVAHGFPPATGTRDVDVIFHDADDVSPDLEARLAEQLLPLAGTLKLDVKNQARVHLWYEERFGMKIKPYESVEAAVRIFHCPATCVAVRPGWRGLDFCAPYGLDDLVGLTVRPNKTLIWEDLYLSKVRRWARIWPQLRISDWNGAPLAFTG